MNTYIDVGSIVVHKDKFVSDYLYVNCQCRFVGITEPGPFMTSRGGLAVVEVWCPNGELKTILHAPFENFRKKRIRNRGRFGLKASKA